MRRSRAGVLVTACVTLLGAGSAQAWQVSSELGVSASGGPKHSVIHLTAAPGEVNELRVVAVTPERVVIHDQGAAITGVGAGCTRQNDRTAHCNLASTAVDPYGVGRLEANLGDGDDKITVLGSNGLYPQLYGGDGNDTLESLARRAPHVEGGEGNDHITVRGDTLGDASAMGTDQRIWAGPGDDFVDTLDGNDQAFNVFCGSGTDTLIGDKNDGLDTPDSEEPRAECETVTTTPLRGPGQDIQRPVDGALCLTGVPPLPAGLKCWVPPL